MALEELYGYESDKSTKKFKGKVARPTQIKLIKFSPGVIKLKKVKGSKISTKIKIKSKNVTSVGSLPKP